MSTLAQVPSAPVDGKVIALSLLTPIQSPSAPASSQRNTPRQYTVYLDGIEGSSEFEIVLPKGTVTLTDNDELVPWVWQRVAMLPFEWDATRYKNVPDELRQTLNEIHEMASWGSDPADEDDTRPEPDALVNAEAWVTGLYWTITTAGYTWVKPNATVSGSGEVVLDWWNRDKALGIYISGQQAIFVKDWGPNIHSEMLDGDAEPLSVRESLWAWLMQ